MANQRIYIHCLACNGEAYLAKRMAVGFYEAQDLQPFFDDHEECGDAFVLRYERPQNYETSPAATLREKLKG